MEKIPKNVTIRPMQLTDYDGVYKLWLSCAGMGLNNLDDSRDGIAKFLARNPETCSVAETNGRVVGVIMAGHDGRRGYIYHTAVAEDFRGRGIANGLVETSLEALKNQSINKVALVVFNKNQLGNDFWQKIGFEARDDLVYRNKNLVEIVRIDT